MDFYILIYLGSYTHGNHSSVSPLQLGYSFNSPQVVKTYYCTAVTLTGSDCSALRTLGPDSLLEAAAHSLITDWLQMASLIRRETFFEIAYLANLNS